MKTSITSIWKGNLAFESQVGTHTVRTDGPVAIGGDDSGAGPKSLMMVALAGCTGVDVADILKKMRVEVEDLQIAVEAELSEGTPSLYTSMHLVYRFRGRDLDQQKLRRAVELSQEKYCGVSMMYKKIMDISWEIRCEG